MWELTVCVRLGPLILTSKPQSEKLTPTQLKPLWCLYVFKTPWLCDADNKLRYEVFLCVFSTFCFEMSRRADYTSLRTWTRPVQSPSQQFPPPLWAQLMDCTVGFDSLTALRGSAHRKHRNGPKWTKFLFLFNNQHLLTYNLKILLEVSCWPEFVFRPFLCFPLNAPSSDAAASALRLTSPGTEQVLVPNMSRPGNLVRLHIFGSSVPVPSHMSWAPMSDSLKIALKDKVIRFCGPKIKGQGHCDFFILFLWMQQEPWGNLCKIGANICMASKINWLDFVGSKVKRSMHKS